MSQGNSLCGFLKQTNMTLCILRNQRREGQHEVQFGGIGGNGTVEDVGKGCRKVNMVQILCTHVYEWKNDTS
jgi:hypothetical protein